MSKPEELYVNGYDFFFWPYEEQTQMKHKVLVEYFRSWATILGKYSTVNFFDCHGGCGAYLKNDTPCWGSSLLVAIEADKLKQKLGRNVNIYVSESDHDNKENLKKIIKSHKLTTVLKVVEITFEDMVKNPNCIRIYSKIPSLFFIDPFGYSLDYSLLEQIMRYPQNELLINFMFYFITRFIALPDQAENFDKLFGCQDWRDAIPLSGVEREKKLVEVYKRQLKKFAKYVFAYRLSFYDKNRTYYYIFHATNHIKGCNIMKSSFATLNNGKVEYLGQRNDFISFFDLDEVKTQEIKDYLLRHFTRKEITFDQIVDEIIEDTFYLEKDIRAALHSLNSENKISVTPVTSHTQKGLSGADIICFTGVTT